MLPDEVYKRKHFGTPQSFFLITANFVTLTIAIQCFADCSTINWFFWIVIGLLALYNAYQLHREREEYDKPRIIAYVISLATMVLLFFILRSGSHHC